MNCQALSFAAFAAAVLFTATAQAGQIAWGDVFVVDDPSDVKSPAGGALILAADFNNATGGAAGEDDMINGIPFQIVDQNVPGILTTNIASGPSYNATYVGLATGDGDLDALLDAHSYIAGNPATAMLTLEGLEAGANYHVQLIAVADDRACCAARVYELDDGAGAFTTGKTMQRGLHQSVIGTFAATATTQVIQLRSLNAAAGNNDPGLSGMLIFKVGAAGDADGDGLPDAWETAFGLNPASGDSDGDQIADALEDGDADGLNNAAELTAGTKPNDDDTDDDGLKDGVESKTGTWVSASNTGSNPLIADTDGDALSDGVENPDLPFTGPTQTNSDPNIKDTDGDGFADAAEVVRNSDPGNPASTPAGVRFTVLGTGSGALLGGDLTDPDNNIDDSTPEGSFFDWLTSTASSENYFGTEGALDIFDNKVGAGVDKWCCDPAPQNVTLEFAGPVTLTHFTISSGNDVPERDPVDWEILGSNDGVQFTPVFTWTDPGSTSIWTERLQVIRVDLQAPSGPWKFLQYSVTRTAGVANHQINEIEYFGTMAAAADFRITEVTRNPATGAITLAWTSTPGRAYTVYYSTSVDAFGSNVADNIPADAGETTSYTFPNPLPGESRIFFRIGRNP